MFDTVSILRRAAEKGSFERTRYIESNIPTTFSDITIMTFFGDMRSTFILSSLLLKRYKEEVKGSKYFILLTWPGYESLFPYVDEYWTFADKTVEPRLRSEAVGFENTSSIDILYKKQINHFFDDHVDSSSLKQFYNNGIQQDFSWKESARHYIDLYNKILDRKVKAGIEY